MRMNNAELDEFFTRVESGLGPDPSEEEIVEAARAAFLALTDEERQSVSLDEPYRRPTVYGAVEFE